MFTEALKLTIVTTWVSWEAPGNYMACGLGYKEGRRVPCLGKLAGNTTDLF